MNCLQEERNALFLILSSKAQEGSFTCELDFGGDLKFEESYLLINASILQFQKHCSLLNRIQSGNLRRQVVIIWRSINV